MSRPTSTHIALAAAIAGLALPAQAYLRSQSTQGWQLRHDVRIHDHAVRATVHQGWVDVEEEIVLGTQASTGSAVPTDNLSTWEIAGQFNLPEGSVVTGALLWNGGPLLKAKLKSASQASAEYEAVVDRNTAPIPQPRDPLLIEKTGDNYTMKLYPVEWNGSRRMRIRYMVPLQSNGDGWTIPVGSAFAQEAAGHPGQYELDIENQGGTALRLERDGMLTPFSSTTKLVDYPAVQSSPWWDPTPVYHAPFSVVLPQKGSIALATSHDSGAWKGGYVMYKGKLPDSLLSNSHLRQEILVVWKWNSPNGFVLDYGWGEQVSSSGYQMLEQAGQLLSATSQLGRASSLVRVGLLSDEGDSRKLKRFALSKWGTDTFALMQEYLGSLNADTILARYDAPPYGSTGSTGDASKIRKEGAKRLASALEIAFSMYSADSGVVRHIAFVSCGPSADIPDPSVALPAWPEGLTASSWSAWSWNDGYGAHWPGADLPSLVAEHQLPADRRIDNWLPFPVPLTRVTWNLEFTAGEREFSIDAVTGLETGAGANSLIEFNGHARSAWDRKLSWKLYDENGNLVRTAEEPADNWIELPADSSIPRLWGGSRRHWSESWRTRSVGNVFGFVDATHSLLALPSDSLGATLQERYRDRGVPFLLASEIFGTDLGDGTEPTEPEDPPASVRSKANIAGFKVLSLIGGRGLSIRLPDGLDETAEVVVRDIHGRVLARWNASELRSLKTIDWKAPSGAARGMLYVELRVGVVRTVQSASIL